MPGSLANIMSVTPYGGRAQPNGATGLQSVLNPTVEDSNQTFLRRAMNPGQDASFQDAQAQENMEMNKIFDAGADGSQGILSQILQKVMGGRTEAAIAGPRKRPLLEEQF